MLDASERRFIRFMLALELEKTGSLAHVVLFLCIGG
jgi:hypothetical protein